MSFSYKILEECNIFFDIETYNLEENKEIVDIVNYAIGCTYILNGEDKWPNRTEGGEYTSEFLELKKQSENNLKTFYGSDCTNLFFDWLTELVKKHKKIKINAYNVSYDYHQILEEALEYFNSRDMKFSIKKALLDDNKNLIVAEWKISFKEQHKKTYTSRTIRFVDLWRWTGYSLNAWCISLNIPTKPDFDPHKTNMRFENNKPISYMNFERKWIDFDYESEKKYLENDVLACLHIRAEISQTKWMIINAIDNLKSPYTGNKYNVFQMYKSILNSKDKDTHSSGKPLNSGEIWRRFKNQIEAIPTQGSFTKFCAELFRGKKFEHPTESRYNITYEQYEIQDLCFLGGFTSGNNHTTKIKPEDNKTIQYYDINSMYPHIMSGDLPYGPILYKKPKEGKYITWVYLKGTKYKWKPKYDVFDNKFLGDSFFTRSSMKVHLTSSMTSNEWMICKELFDLMKKMCILEDIEVVDYIYQKAEPIRLEYMKCLMNIKERETEAFNKYCKSKNVDINSKEAKQIKLMYFPRIQYSKDLANKSYGKGCEKAHLDTEVWDNNKKAYRDWIDEDKPKGDGKKVYPCLLTGIYVPAIGRTMVLKAAKAIIDAGHKFLYCDTDSMIVEINKNSLPIEKIIKVDKSKTGYWKLEKTGNTFFYAGKRKKYYMDKDKFAHAGFKSEFVEALTPEQVEILYDPNKNVLVINGRILKGFLPNKIYKRVLDRTHAQFNSGTPVSHILYKYKDKFYFREANKRDLFFIGKKYTERWYGRDWIGEYE